MKGKNSGDKTKFIKYDTKEEIYTICPHCGCQDITLVSYNDLAENTNVVCNHCSFPFVINGDIRYPDILERIEFLEKQAEENKETQYSILNLISELIHRESSLTEEAIKELDSVIYKYNKKKTMK